VDKRADIWAFGVVLYEMLTGHAAFRGETTTDLLAAVVSREPEWQALPQGLSPAIRRLLRRCLEKDVRLRLRDIGEARIALAHPDTAEVTTATRDGQSVRPRFVGLLPWAVAAIAIAAGAGAWTMRPATSAPLRKIEISLPTPGAGPTVVLSPDGRRIAFVSLRPNFEIYVINIDGTGERHLTPGPRWVGDSSPSWSPDGRWIAFSSSRLKDGNPEIFKMRPDGSKVTRLTFTNTPREVSPDDGFPNWSPDGRSIVFSSNRADSQHDLWVIRADGKNPRRITRTLGFDDWTAKWSPDGQRIAFWGVGPRVNHVYTVNVDGSELRQVTRGASPEWRR